MNVYELCDHCDDCRGLCETEGCSVCSCDACLDMMDAAAAWDSFNLDGEP